MSDRFILSLHSFPIGTTFSLLWDAVAFGQTRVEPAVRADLIDFQRLPRPKNGELVCRSDLLRLDRFRVTIHKVDVEGRGVSRLNDLHLLAGERSRNDI